MLLLQRGDSVVLDRFSAKAHQPVEQKADNALGDDAKEDTELPDMLAV
jgi:hypothetical protein